MKTKPKITVKTKKTVVVNVTYDFGDYKCHETITNGIVTEQYFTTTKSSKHEHPFTYSNNDLRFYYYPNLNLDNVCLSHDSAYDHFPNGETIIENVDDFDDFDNCYLCWLGMDGWVWRLTDKYPVANVIKEFDYCGGFTDHNFDLEKILKIIKKKSWVLDAKIEEIPYYNREDGSRTKGIKFSVKFTKQLIKRVFNNSEIGPTDEFRIFGVFQNGMDIFGIRKYYKEREY
jgi:hypothetical protein